MDDELYSDIFLCDDFREVCLTQLMDFLFEKINFRLAVITYPRSFFITKILKNFCTENGLYFLNRPHMGNAILHFGNDWNAYYKSLKKGNRKQFRRTKNHLDRLGNWNISCFDLTNDSIEKILRVERFSWKAEWRARRNEDRDHDLMVFLNVGKQKVSANSNYEFKVWILELNGQPIAYQLTLLYNGISYLVKTSYDANFEKITPGKFLINFIVKELFKQKSVDTIDFITDLQFLHSWEPQIRKRERMYIERKPLWLVVLRIIDRYPHIKRLSTLISLELDVILSPKTKKS